MYQPHTPQQQQQQHPQAAQQGAPMMIIANSPWGMPAYPAHMMQAATPQQQQQQQQQAMFLQQQQAAQGGAGAVSPLHMQLLQSNPAIAANAQLQAVLQTVTAEQLLQALLYVQQQHHHQQLLALQQQHAAAAAAAGQQQQQQQQQQANGASPQGHPTPQFVMSGAPQVVYVTSPQGAATSGVPGSTYVATPQGFALAANPQQQQSPQHATTVTPPSNTPPPTTGAAQPSSTSPPARGAAAPDSNTADPPMPPPAPGDTEPGPRQLIVNYLPVDATDDELQALFTGIGPVEAARVIFDKATRRTKGFGFVYFKHHAHAVIAVRTLTGLQLRGKRLKVSYAVPQRPVSSLLADDMPTPTVTPNANGIASPSQLTGHFISAAPPFDFALPTSVKKTVPAAPAATATTKPAAVPASGVMLNLSPGQPSNTNSNDQHHDSLPASVVEALLDGVRPPNAAAAQSDATDPAAAPGASNKAALPAADPLANAAWLSGAGTATWGAAADGTQ